MTSLTPKFVDIENARLDEQRQVMEKIIAEGHCPFCLENLQLYHKKPFLKKGTYWWVTENQWPYENTKHHFLAIYTQHAEKLSDIQPEAGQELLQLFAEIETEFTLPGGGFAMRFGDTNYSAGTINHIHAQLIQPEIEKPDFKPVRFKIGKTQSV